MRNLQSRRNKKKTKNLIRGRMRKHLDSTTSFMKGSSDLSAEMCVPRINCEISLPRLQVTLLRMSLKNIDLKTTEEEEKYIV